MERVCRTPLGRHRESILSSSHAFYENPVPGPGELFVRWNGSREREERQEYAAKSPGLKTSHLA